MIIEANTQHIVTIKSMSGDPLTKTTNTKISNEIIGISRESTIIIGIVIEIEATPGILGNQTKIVTDISREEGPEIIREIDIEERGKGTNMILGKCNTLYKILNKSKEKVQNKKHRKLELIF